MAAVAVLAMLALFLLVETLGGLSNIGRSSIPPTNVITVTGEGRVSRTPDVARLTFTVMQDASTVAAAQEEVTKQTNGVLEYVKKEGIPDKDVKTLSYNITPQYSYPNQCPPGSMCPVYRDTTPKIIGYQVSQTVQITVRDLDKVSPLLGGLGSRNVQNLYGPDFSLDDPTAVQNEAREEAITQAQEEAKTLAKQLGVRLVRIVSFNENGYPYPVYYGKGGDMALGSVEQAPQVPTGENEFTSTVSITYEIR